MGTNPETCLNGMTSGNWVRDIKKLPMTGNLDFKMEQTMGLEPTTSAMARRRSSQLSYVCISI